MKGVATIAVICLCLATLLGGAAPFGRVLLAVGLPDVAGHFFTDPEWRGIAAYRAGRFEAASADFTAAESHFNLGNAAVQAGRYAAALEAYDLALVGGGDPAARANFDLISAFYAGLAIDPDAVLLMEERGEGPKEESFIARGDARAAGTGTEVTNHNTMLGLVPLDSRGRTGVRQIFDDKFMIANDRWLATLEDVPGAFMDARIKHEHKQRQKLGLSPPEPEDPR